jgi:hypothetical protein
MFRSADIIASAREQTGLPDLADAWTYEGLEELLRSLRDEAKLSPRGWESTKKRLVGALKSRLRVEDWLSRHPEILDQPIERPMFVFGLPRTGTTLLINLLSQDSERRCMLRWEVLSPVPPPKAGEFRSDPRYHQEQDALELSMKYAPHISAIHHEDADSPSECQFSMAQTFCAEVFASSNHIPSYEAWWLAADYRPTFAYQKRLLQLLQSEAPGRWTLKNPWHALYLDALYETYPDAQFVMTHRAPEAVVASYCSLIRAVRSMMSDDVDLAAIGQRALNIFKEMLARVAAYRAEHGADAICDVDYKMLTRDPIDAVAKVYAHFGETLSADAEARMRGFLADNPQGKHGSHQYALEDYGLTADMVRERLGEG